MYGCTPLKRIQTIAQNGRRAGAAQNVFPFVAKVLNCVDNGLDFVLDSRYKLGDFLQAQGRVALFVWTLSSAAVFSDAVGIICFDVLGQAPFTAVAAATTATAVCAAFVIDWGGAGGGAAAASAVAGVSAATTSPAVLDAASPQELFFRQSQFDPYLNGRWNLLFRDQSGSSTSWSLRVSDGNRCNGTCCRMRGGSDRRFT